jgi:GT2 family glycosyltransferase
MGIEPAKLSIIIPTKNRVKILIQLIQSIARLNRLSALQPEVIVVDNGSDDGTDAYVNSIGDAFPVSIGILKVARPGKSAAMNDAAKQATGEILAFLDDDVIVDKNWLTSVADFFARNDYRAGQGAIQLPAAESCDPEVLRLVDRFRTIPRLEYSPDLKTVHSLNGANFFVAREVFDRVGGFDERLGPGASGTSEDVEFARRLTGAGIAIGYAPRAVVYHRIDRGRLTEEYFRQSHMRQGASRFLIGKHSSTAIFLNLARALAQYGYYKLCGKERDRYRSKGRIYHYQGMIQARHTHKNGRPTRESGYARDCLSPPR